MIRPILAQLRPIFEIFWRRRRLLFIPILLSFPLSIVGAFVAPTIYVSKALLLLQESASDNFAPREAISYGDTTKDKIAGLQAFMKSEHILLPVAQARLGARDSANLRLLEIEVEALRNRLTLELIGNDFLQFQIRGGQPEGLRPTLEAVISRFLGSLIAPEETVLSATQLVKDRSAKELEVAERQLSEAQRRLSQLPTDPGNGRALGQFKEQLAAKTAELDAARDAVNRARAEVTEDIREGGDLDRQIEALKAVAAESGAGPARDRLDRLIRFQEAVQRHDRIQRDLDEISRAYTALERATNDRTELRETIARLQQQHDEARRLHDTYALRFSAPTPLRSLNVLKAPERIRVVDPPKDPVAPVITRRQIATAGIFAGLLLALALVVATELLDPHVWRIGEFTSITGLPVIAQLPVTDEPLGLPDGAGIGNQRARVEAFPQHVAS